MGTEVNQRGVDYTSLHGSHEVVIRVELIERRLKDINADRRGRVVEIGVGSGDTTKLLVDHFEDVTCVDIEQDRLDEVAQFVAPRKAQFICADAADVKFGRQFDHVFIIGLLEHCPDAVAVLNNVKTLLKDAGRIHVLVNNAGSIHRHLGVNLGMIDSVSDLSESDRRFGHYRVYSPNALYAEMSKAGLRVDYIDQHYMKPLPSSMMDALPLELSRAFVELGRKFTQFAAYTYLEAVKQ